MRKAKPARQSLSEVKPSGQCFRCLGKCFGRCFGRCFGKCGKGLSSCDRLDLVGTPCRVQCQARGQTAPKLTRRGRVALRSLRSLRRGIAVSRTSLRVCPCLAPAAAATAAAPRAMVTSVTSVTSVTECRRCPFRQRVRPHLTHGKCSRPRPRRSRTSARP